MTIISDSPFKQRYTVKSTVLTSRTYVHTIALIKKHNLTISIVKERFRFFLSFKIQI